MFHVNTSLAYRHDGENGESIMTQRRNNRSNATEKSNKPDNLVYLEHEGVQLEVCARPFKNPKYSLASVSITIVGVMVIGDIYLNESKSGNWYLSYPSYKVNDSTYKDMTFPLSKELRDKLEDAAAESYDIATNNDR